MNEEQQKMLMDMNNELRNLHLKMEQETNMYKLADLYETAAILLRTIARYVANVV